TIGAGGISAAGVKKGAAASASAPDDHFAAGPHCCVNGSGSGRVAGAGGCPTVGAGVVSAAGVKIDGAAASSAPDDHLIAGPDRRVIGSGIGRVGEAGWSPRVVGAATRRTRYHGKRVRSFVEIRGIDAALCRGNPVGCEEVARRRRYACYYSWISGQAFR